MIGKKHKDHTGVPQARKKLEKDLVPRSERKLKGSSRERRTIVQVVDGGGMKLRLRDGTHNRTQCTVDPECVTKINKMVLYTPCDGAFVDM